MTLWQIVTPTDAAVPEICRVDADRVFEPDVAIRMIESHTRRLQGADLPPEECRCVAVPLPEIVSPGRLSVRSLPVPPPKAVTFSPDSVALMYARLLARNVPAESTRAVLEEFDGMLIERLEGSKWWDRGRRALRVVRGVLAVLLAV